MNEVASAQALDVAMWAFGGLLALLAVLIGVIRRHDLNKVDNVKESLDKRVDDLNKSVDWIEEYHVSKETLDRVERTFRDAIDAMTESRKEMHKENQKGIEEIKQSITGIHRRIDEEFRVRNQK